MLYIHAEKPDEMLAEMAGKISGALKAGRKVLWLICGGSNIPGAVLAMELIRKIIPAEKISELLTISQTDERYGPVGHKDSNWKQMLDDGFAFGEMKQIPILTGKLLEDTVADFAGKIEPAMKNTIASGGLIIAQFGMGADGHIAGMLPHTPAVNEKGPVSGYESKPFIRISLTPPALRKIQVAYAFVFGEEKEKAVTDLHDKDLPLEDEPAQILKQIPEATLVTDLI